jgi:hypothetical protein
MSYPLAMNILLCDRKDFDVRPDLLVIFPRDGQGSRKSIAVEFERTVKSKKRLYRKLKKYTSATRLDGLVYICEADTITNKLSHIYASRVLGEALRIKHYGNNFLMFATNTATSKVHGPILVNTASQVVSLQEWGHWLRTTERHFRRNSQIGTSAPTS